jgi:hypothetical protein
MCDGLTVSLWVTQKFDHRYKGNSSFTVQNASAVNQKANKEQRLKLLRTHPHTHTHTPCTRVQQQSQQTDPKPKISNWWLSIANSSVGTEISPMKRRHHGTPGCSTLSDGHQAVCMCWWQRTCQKQQQGEGPEDRGKCLCHYFRFWKK